MLGKPDWEVQLDRLRAEGERMIATGEKLAEEVQKIQVSRTSSDGAVTIDLTKDGALDRVQLGHRACELGHTKLTALINETFAAARSAYARQYEALVDSTFGDKPQTREMLLGPVADVLAEDEEAAATPVSGRWAPVEPEPEPAPVARPRPAPPKSAPPQSTPRRSRGAADDADYGEDRPW